jgi:hypothetical protein
MYKIANSVGAKIISAGFGVGEYNLIVVVEADEAQAAAVALKVNPSGTVLLSVIPIMSAADMDMSRAIAMGAEWKAPGTSKFYVIGQIIHRWWHNCAPIYASLKRIIQHYTRQVFPSIARSSRLVPHGLAHVSHQNLFGVVARIADHDAIASRIGVAHITTTTWANLQVIHRA